eukprot:scaffold5067_cov161-Skeletonema_menzelii.AAC.13
MMCRLQSQLCILLMLSFVIPLLLDYRYEYPPLCATFAIAQDIVMPAAKGQRYDCSLSLR